jgi:tRNA A-37 threonylcarbamoyl transferase component Bud32
VAGELPPGTEIAGFRIERTLGRGRAAAVYEATQIDLDRRVALKLFDRDSRLGARLRTLRWPEHARIVRMYAAGTSEYGDFLALQLVRGSTIAEMLDAGGLKQGVAAGLLEDVGAVLDTAHRAGYVHGAVQARNVFVDRDGRALLSDFGLGKSGADVETDRADFAALAHDSGGRTLPEPLPASAIEIVRAAFPRRKGWKLALPAAGALLAIAAIVTAAVLAHGGSSEQAPPPVLAGAVALGSDLPATGVRSVDCMGSPPSGASEACTVVQATLDGRAVVPQRSGVIRRWSVRGARGDIALEVLRRRGKKFFMVARTQYATLEDAGLHVLPAYLPVQPGDLVGLQVTPGAIVGIRDGDREAATARWFGPLVYEARPAERSAGTGFDHEVLLRVEYAPGVSWRPPGQLTGRAAERAPSGRVSSRLVLDPGPPLSFVVARVGGRVAVDLLTRWRRLVRLGVPDANAGGKLASVEVVSIRLGRPIVRLSWQNPDVLVVHEYVAGRRTLTPLS